MRLRSPPCVIAHQTWDSRDKERGERDRLTRQWAPAGPEPGHTWHWAWAGPARDNITPGTATTASVPGSQSPPEHQCEVTSRDHCDTSDPGHHHGAPHRCRPRGLHPPGQDQHGGVHQEFENKVRLLCFSWMSYSSDERVTNCRLQAVLSSKGRVNVYVLRVDHFSGCTPIKLQIITGWRKCLKYHILKTGN